MRRQVTQLAVLAALATSLIAFAFASPAAAQRSVPVTIGNDDAAPVPVYQAGRTPYQFTYSMSATASGEECDAIPVPDGMVLTVTGISADAWSDDSTSPIVYVTNGRRTSGSGFLYRSRLKLEYESSSGTRRYYSGLQNTSMYLGPATGTANYTTSICVRSPDTGYASARGIVTGYVESTTIIDGNQLP